VADAWAPYTAVSQLGIFGARWTPFPVLLTCTGVQAQHTRSQTTWQKNFLDFEQPIAELESKIEELRYVQTRIRGRYL
jgi:hypothetical protein